MKNLTPEELLILTSVKLNPTKPEWERMDDLVLQVQDWDYFCTLIIERGMAPLFYKKIPLLKNKTLLPASNFQLLQQTYFHTLSRSTLMYNAFAEIAKVLSDNYIPVIALKGIYLSEKLYGDVGLRQMSDIDLLIKPEDADKCHEIFAGLGYKSQEEELTEFEKKLEIVHFDPLVKNGISVELHLKLHRDNEKYKLDTSSLWSNAKLVSINSQLVYTLDLYDTLIHLCVHVDRHAKIGGVQFTGFNDIVNLLDVYNGSLDWDQLSKYCKQYNAEREVYKYLILLNKYMGACVPDNVLIHYQNYLTIYDETLFCKYLRGYTGFRSGMQKHFGNYMHLELTKDKLYYTWKIIFPTSKFMVSKFNLKNDFLLPFYYPYRWWLGIKGLIQLFIRK